MSCGCDCPNLIVRFENPDGTFTYPPVVNDVVTIPNPLAETEWVGTGVGGITVSQGGPNSGHTPTIGLKLDPASILKVVTVDGQQCVTADISALTPTAPYVFDCAELNDCSIGDLGNVSLAGCGFGDVLTIDASGNVVCEPLPEPPAPYEFDCSELNSCSISDLLNVDTAGASNGDILVFDGTSWTPATPDTPAAPYVFDCAELESCSINSLANVDLTGGAAGDLLSIDGSGNVVPVTPPAAVTPYVFDCAELSSCAIDSLSDVAAAGNAGDVLRWDGTTYQPVDPSDVVAECLTGGQITAMPVIPTTGGPYTLQFDPTAGTLTWI